MADTVPKIKQRHFGKIPGAGQHHTSPASVAAVEAGQVGIPMKSMTGAPYHASQDPANMDTPNNEPYQYPTSIKPFWVWVTGEEELSIHDWRDNKRGYLATLGSELLASFIFFFIVVSATSTARTYGNILLFTAWIPLVAGAVYAMEHFIFTKFSFKLFPQHTLLTLVMQHSWVNRRHYTIDKKESELRVGQALIEALLELIGQGAGTLAGVILAASLEDGSMLANTGRAGAPVFQFFVDPTHRNYVVFFVVMMAQFVITLGYAMSTLEVPRQTVKNPLYAMYAGIAMFLGYWIAMEKTGAVFSVFQMFATAIVRKTTELVPVYNEWALLLGGTFVGAALALLFWFFALRVTWMENNTYDPLKER